MDAVEIFPPDGPINATVRPPGSKSITNRALPIAAVAKGTSTLTGVLKSDDTIYMIKALKQLGVEIDDSRLSDIPEESVVIVHGCDGRFPATKADLFLGNSGTSIRFLTAMVAAAGRGTYRLDGIERMRERPIGDLVDALRELGVEVTYALKDGFPPLRVSSAGFNGSQVEIGAGTSSQFLSGLMLGFASQSDADRIIRVVGNFVSIPYVEMTMWLIQSFQCFAKVSRQYTPPTSQPLCEITVSPKYAPLKKREYTIQPDASAASYWYAANELVGGVEVLGLRTKFRGPSAPIQGDVAFASVIKEVGKSTTFDFSDISDTAQTMAAVAVFADSPTTVTGVEHMRHKECDRVSAVVTELRKLGIECDEHTDGYTIYPGTPVCKEPIETYDDHRMAMSFALLGLKVPGIIIKDPDCVNKTYPRFWDDWAKVTGQPVRRFTL